MTVSEWSECRDLQAEDDVWLRDIEATAAGRGYSVPLVHVLSRLLRLDPAARRKAAELHAFLLEMEA